MDGLTPLMIAAEKGHTGVVNLLVENGAKLDIQDKDDHTFFHICAEYNQSDIIKVKVTATHFFWIKESLFLDRDRKFSRLSSTSSSK